MASNVTFAERISANRIYFLIAKRSIGSIGYMNTAKLALLRLKAVNNANIVLKGRRFGVNRSNFAEILHNEIWALERGDSRIKVGRESMRFDYNGREVIFKIDKKSRAVTNDTMGLISEQFFSEQYDFKDIEGSAVVDIGANIGDSAIYFALNGARKVFAFEPYPHLYEQARRNVAANRLGNVIIINNEGVSGETSSVRISEREHGIGSSRLKNFNEGRKVNVVTLRQIVDRYKLEDALLKSDCEGFEYEIFLKTDDKTLRAFRSIVIEYHKGYINLVRRLRKAGFRVTHSKPLKMLFADGSESGYAGMIWAVRENSS